MAPFDTQLTPLQLDVMRALWSRDEASVHEVTGSLAGARRLAPTTVATLLRRLEKRGLVVHRRAGRQFVYRAAVAESVARALMVDDLAERLFSGDAARLVHHLLARHELAPDDLARVRALIETRERNREVRDEPRERHAGRAPGD